MLFSALCSDWAGHGALDCDCFGCSPIARLGEERRALNAAVGHRGRSAVLVVRCCPRKLSGSAPNPIRQLLTASYFPDAMKSTIFFNCSGGNCPRLLILRPPMNSVGVPVISSSFPNATDCFTRSAVAG